MPVRDLTIEDFRLREDGTDREIVAVKPATDPLQIVLLADSTTEADKLIRDVRVSLTAFVKQVHATSPDAAISLMEFGQAAVTMVPYRDAMMRRFKAASPSWSDGPGAASVLLEAIIEASNSLGEAPQPAARDCVAEHRADQRAEPGRAEEDQRIAAEVAGPALGGLGAEPEDEPEEPDPRRRAERRDAEQRRQPRVHQRTRRRSSRCCGATRMR